MLIESRKKKIGYLIEKYILTHIIVPIMKIVAFRYLLVIQLSLSAMLVVAQNKQEKTTEPVKKERTIALWGHIKDSFTKVGIEGTRITLMRPDSSVIDTQTVNYFNGRTNKIDTYYRFDIPARPQKYIIRAEHPDYLPCYIDFDIRYVARNNYFDAPWHYMKKRPRRMVDKDHALKEAQVTATKIKMVYKGDTVVYNADAFNLPQGSMLDDLLKQMPGVVLKDNGEIYLNGKKVDYLMLNGKQFFKGKNNIMLENLPYYTIKNVQFYDKSTAKSEYMKQEVEQKEFVMDVNLKKEYSTGYIMSAEAAGGTNERFLGRLFGLRYTDNTRISVFGNMNNINEYRKPGREGDWEPTDNPEGQMAVRTAGVDVNLDDKEERYTNNLSLTLRKQNSDFRSLGASEKFLSDGNIFSREQSSIKSNYFQVGGYNSFEWKKTVFLQLDLSWEYSRYDYVNSNRSATFSENPFAWGGTMQILDSLFNTTMIPSLYAISINRQKDEGTERGHYGNLDLQAQITKKLSWGDEFDITVTGSYGNRSRKTNELYQLDYLKTTSSDFRNKYTDVPAEGYRYKAGAGYIFHLLNNWNYHFWGNYTERFTTEENSLYRLDKLDGWGNGSGYAPGDLPSTRDSLLLALDASNSYHKKYLTQSGNGAFRIYYEKRKKDNSTWFNFQTVVQRQHERLDYQRNMLDTTLTQNNWIVKPEMTFIRQLNNFNRRYQLNYDMQLTTADMVSKINVRDDSNPLSIRLGNPDLKNSITHTVRMYFSDQNPKTQRDISLNMGISILSRQMANGFTYNVETGVYTYRPQNVDGNSRISVGFNYNRPVDKTKLWNLDNRLNWSYNHNVDMTAVSGSNASELSRVNNNSVDESVSLKYQKGDLQWGLNGNVQWNNATSDRANFQTINAVDFNYGLTSTYKLLKKVDLASDIKMFSRRGYSDSRLNTDNLIWNASVGTSFDKGKLIMRLEGFDLLQQLSSVQYYVNGQGRTETWRNTIPSYVMLHAIYRLNVNPKKK